MLHIGCRRPNGFSFTPHAYRDVATSQQMYGQIQNVFPGGPEGCEASQIGHLIGLEGVAWFRRGITYLAFG